MKRIYEAPELFTDEYVADTMIASSGVAFTAWQQMGGIGFAPKNGNAANNHNCWGCELVYNTPDPSDPSNACMAQDFGEYGIC